MDFGALVLRDGDRVTASGRLIRTDQGDWLQPSTFGVDQGMSVADLGRGERRIAPPRRGAVRLVGADFDALANRLEQGGAVDGFATVTGVWSGEQLRVSLQTPPEPRSAWVLPWTTPPCPPPSGGWPQVTRRGDIMLDYDLGDLLDTGAAVTVTHFRPADNQAVLVVAASDQAAVEARLRPQLGDLLCVVPSRWTKAQLEEVRSYLHQRFEQWNLHQLGPQVTADGQTRITARLVRVLPEVAAWADSLPDGIVALDPWLAPQQPTQR